MRAASNSLIVIGGNPAYDAPADLGIKDLLPNVKFSARLGLYEDETSALCHWHIPQTHFLEEWGDARAFDGTISIIQPLIAPLYDGKSACELVALLAGQPGQSNHDMVQELLEDAGGRRAGSAEEGCGATRRGDWRLKTRSTRSGERLCAMA